MNVGRWLLQRNGSMILPLLMGLSAASLPELVQAESCVLTSQHAGVTFPVEKVDPVWVCRLQSIVDNYTIEHRGADSGRPVRVDVSVSIGSSPSRRGLDQTSRSGSLPGGKARSRSLLGQRWRRNPRDGGTCLSGSHVTDLLSRGISPRAVASEYNGEGCRLPQNESGERGKRSRGDG